MKKLLLLLVATAALASCVAPGPKQQVLWQFDGKFSWRSPQKNQTGYIAWQQFENAYAIRLWGALGLGTTTIEGNENRLIIDNGKQQRIVGTDESTYLLPGINIPVGALAHSAQTVLRDLPSLRRQLLKPSWIRKKGS